MHILLIPDSFKDSITASDIVRQLSLGFSKIDPSITTESCIASDGGEGFLSFVKTYVATTMVSVKTVDPLGRTIEAEYAFAKASKTAYIELAKASGLELLSKEERNPMNTSTSGTGLQIKDAIEKGAVEIYVGLGGSATNDGGVGMAHALGYEFLDDEGSVLDPKGCDLSEIYSIRKPDKLNLPKIYAINDVDNVLIGPLGAAHTYGKQKGASEQEIKILDNGLRQLAHLAARDLSSNEAKTPGAGAAGGSGFGLRTFFNATFIPGIAFLARLSGIEKNLEEGHIDLILTGEGSIDHQTLRGKLVKGVGALGKKYAIPVMAICGVKLLEDQDLRALGLKNVFAVSDLASSKEDSFKNAAKYIKELSKHIFEHYHRSNNESR